MGTESHWRFTNVTRKMFTFHLTFPNQSFSSFRPSW